MKIITWNMQGSSHYNENKWNEAINHWFRLDIGADVVCIQECGNIPESAELIIEHIDDMQDFNLYLWGTARSSKYILYYPWDQGGNRCNLAVVSKIAPSEYIVDGNSILGAIALFPDSRRSHRPIIGMLISDIWVYSIHAISKGGPDALELIECAANFMPNKPWIVAGDYNRVPETLEGYPFVICPPNNPTYSTLNPRSKYDYMTKSEGDIILGSVYGLIMSDHYPVFYNIIS